MNVKAVPESLKTDPPELVEKPDVEVFLTFPISAHGEVLRKLTLRDPCIGDLRGVKPALLVNAADGTAGLQLDLGALVPAIAACAQIPPSSAEKIKARDLKAIAPVVLDFLDLSDWLPTGSG